MNRNFYYSLCTLLLVPLLFQGEARAQSTEGNAYYQTFPDLLTTRFYFSRKYTRLRLRDQAAGQAFHYEPNSSLNMGVGATYSWATLNLAYGFGFLNPDEGQGESRYLDLQAHAYPSKYVIDLFGQFYKGYYLLPKGKGTSGDQPFYVRPDLNLIKLGASVQYVFNHGRFSYRAAFLQNEWQKKSAGTFLLGFEWYGGRVLADSGMVPAAQMRNPERNFRTLRFFDGGPTGGYAYTLVIRKHFFFTGSATTSLGLSHSLQAGESGRGAKWGLAPNVFFRIFFGYNGERWSVNANHVLNTVRLVPNQHFANSLRTGNYRVNLIYRFRPGPAFHRFLRPVEKVSEWLSPD